MNTKDFVVYLLKRILISYAFISLLASSCTSTGGKPPDPVITNTPIPDVSCNSSIESVFDSTIEKKSCRYRIKSKSEYSYNISQNDAEENLKKRIKSEAVDSCESIIFHYYQEELGSYNINDYSEVVNKIQSVLQSKSWAEITILNWETTPIKNKMFCGEMDLIITPNNMINKLMPDKNEEIAWLKIKDKNDIQLFISFIKRYPKGKYKPFAEEKIQMIKEEAEWAMIKNSLNINDFTLFLHNFPNTKRKETIRQIFDKIEKNEWLAIENTESTDQVNLFINKFSNLDLLFNFYNCILCEEAKKRIAILKQNIQIKEFDLVQVQPGSFIMGCNTCREDSKPEHKVFITKPYFICKHEVTVSDYSKFIEDTGKQTNWSCTYLVSYNNWKNRKMKQNHPINCVSWEDANSYIDWLNYKYQKTTGLKFRLCTEAEWEYAACGGETQTETKKFICKFPKHCLKDHAWFRENAFFNTTKRGTREVQKLQKNKLGISDMSGNVWEWVQDSYEIYQDKEAIDPRGADISNSKVIRGGAFNSKRGEMSIKRRNYNWYNYRSGGIGFRICAEKSE